MEVLRRFKLPDAKSVIPKFGSSNSHQSALTKERELPAPATTVSESGAKGGAKVTSDRSGASNHQLGPKKARGKQPVAPKPDENTDLLGQRSKPLKTPSVGDNTLSPKSPRTRASHGRALKRPGRVNVNKGSGGTSAQDPPGNVQRKQSMVAAQIRHGAGSPGSSSSSPLPESPIVTPVPKHGKRNALKKSGKVLKGAAANVQPEAHPNGPTVIDCGDAAMAPSETRPIGRGPLGMERRPTPAPLVLQSPSGVDSKKSNVVMSSLLNAGGGVIGVLEGAADDFDDNERMIMMGQETPRTRNVGTVAAESLVDGSGLPTYPVDNNSSETGKITANAAHVGGEGEMGDDEASLPDAPHELATSKHATSLDSSHPLNPNDSTTSLGRQSTTSAAVRRRGRSHSRTRRTEPIPTSVSVGDGTSTVATCPGSPSRPVLRSRSQRRQRRSRSNSRSNRSSRTTDAAGPSAAASSSPKDGSDSPGASVGVDAARLSPAGGGAAGRRPQRAPPVTKRTHAQKMSMKNAIKAADLDMLTPSAMDPTPTGVPTSTASSSVAPSAPSPFAGAAAAAALAEAARWRSPPDHDDGPARERRPAKPVGTPPAATVPSAATPGEMVVDAHTSGGGGDAAQAGASHSGGGGGGPAPKNPVRALAQGLLKRRPSFRAADAKVSPNKS